MKIPFYLTYTNKDGVRIVIIDNWYRYETPETMLRFLLVLDRKGFTVVMGVPD
jgi:hypothetical protein